jgi:hypothetical protein
MSTPTPHSPEQLHIHLRYVGPDVTDGSMRIEDVAKALHGFAGAYEKIAADISPLDHHELRVAGINPTSFDIIILAAMGITRYADQLSAIKSAAEGIVKVIQVITSVVLAKKHTKGKPFQIAIKGDNNVVIVNSEGSEMKIEPKALEILQEKAIDVDLNKIVEPLRLKSIEEVQLKTDLDPGATITSQERDYFLTEPSSITSQDVEIVGSLVSLNKERNRGTFKLKNNVNVPYQYIGPDREKFHADFSYEGPVQASCVAEFDDALQVTRLEIKAVEPLQSRLALPSSDSTSAEK